MSDKETLESNIEDAFDALRQQRDELRVKLHLGSMEVRDEWEELEGKWENLLAKKDQLKDELEPTVADAKVAWLMLKDEIKDGYKTIRNRLAD